MSHPYRETNGDHSGKRISTLTLIVFFVSAILLFKMFQKSVLEHSQYAALAKNQYYIKEENPSKRGKIYAQDITAIDGKYPLAINVEKFGVNVIPKNIKDKNETAKQLAIILQMAERDIFDKINNNKPYIPPLARKIEKDVADKIINLDLAGVYMQSENYRYYPEDNLASQLLGFVNSEGAGNYGVEAYYNDLLRGRGGEVEGEKDTLGRIISIVKQEEVRDGTDLVLTIERNVQYMAQEKLKAAIEKYQADDGVVIIVEPQTGKIIAMVTLPDFNPNKYNELKQEDQKLFLNPAIANVFEPGSIIKPLIMGIALNEGKIQPDTEEIFSNFTVVQGYEIHTAQDKAFGKETMTQVLENSDNVAMIWVADKLGNDEMYKYLQRFGLT